MIHVVEELATENEIMNINFSGLLSVTMNRNKTKDLLGSRERVAWRGGKSTVLWVPRWQRIIGRCTFHIINPQFPHPSINYALLVSPSSFCYIYFSHPTPHASAKPSDQKQSSSSPRMAMEPLPLLVGDGKDAALFSSSFWSFQDELLHQQPQEVVINNEHPSLPSSFPAFLGRVKGC
jgi:hypothetical protein